MTSILAGDLYAAGAPRRELPLKMARRDGPVLVELVLRAREDRVSCVYLVTVAGGRVVDRVDFHVRVSWSDCHYGGRRAWLHCSRKDCGRRVGRLFVVAPDLLCRSCADIRYRTQTLNHDERRRERAHAIRARLGQDLREAWPLARPKGMHWATYDQLRAELYEIESEYRFDLFRELLAYELEKSERNR